MVILNAKNNLLGIFSLSLDWNLCLWRNFCMHGGYKMLLFKVECLQLGKQKLPTEFQQQILKKSL